MSFFKEQLTKLKMFVKKRLLDLVQDPFDPAQFNDPLALEIEWGSLNGGGTNFCTHRLRKIYDDRIEFKSTFKAKMFCFFFMLIGLFLLSPIYFMIVSGEGIGVGILFPLLFGGPFFAIGSYMFYRGSIPIVFDKHKGYYWHSRKSPDQFVEMDTINLLTALEDIHAIQLISEYCSGEKSSFYSYEINLVLHNGERINVVDHGKKSQILLDSELLAEFLQVTVWDAM